MQIRQDYWVCYFSDRAVRHISAKVRASSECLTIKGRQITEISIMPIHTPQINLSSALVCLTIFIGFSAHMSLLFHHGQGYSCPILA